MNTTDRMRRGVHLHLFAPDSHVPALLGWLSHTCGIEAKDIASAIYESLEPEGSMTGEGRIRPVLARDLKRIAAADDLFIVAGDRIDAKVARLFDLDFYNVYDGNEMLRSSAPAASFARAASRFFLGPIVPLDQDPGAAEALRSPQRALMAGSIPRHLLFTVNSLPKSGTLWMVGMLSRLMDVRPREQLVVSHVADIEVDMPKRNNHASVTLVRDMRDVVVSWFHDAARADARLGFRAPRYPTIQKFYREFFLGTLLSSDRYYRGDLCYWINRNCAHYIPLIRYEDLCVDPRGAVGSVLNAWRIECEADTIKRVCDEFFRERLAGGSIKGDDYVSQQFRSGHLRRGVAGSWRDELPDEIARDIERRFAEYQERLGYSVAGSPAAG